MSNAKVIIKLLTVMVALLFCNRQAVAAMDLDLLSQKAIASKATTNPGAQSFEVVDVQSVTADNPANGIRTFTLHAKPHVVHCDIFIAGGGMGGLAAGFRASQCGAKVCLTEETNWLGGQMTQQGVAALDENYLVETSGATRLYQELRTRIRAYYRQHPGAALQASNDELLNPGNCWVTRLSFEPQVALDKLADLMHDNLRKHTPAIFSRTKVVRLKIAGGRIKSALAVNLDDGRFIEFRARYFIDATELGDLLPMAGVPYSYGAESNEQTGEPHAPDQANIENVQDFTYPFVVEFHEGTRNVIAKPPHYDEFLRAGKFTFAGYKMFVNSPAPDGQYEFLPFWTYRRLIAKENFPASGYDSDLSMINWESNDLRGENIIDQSAAAEADRLALAKNLSLGFLHWLQTEAPRDDGGKGYPELSLQLDVLGTADGLSKFPYIRESRRIKAVTTVVEQDIAAATNGGARARLFDDSVGIGLYPIDIHGLQDVPGAGQAAKPFQIPLGALVQTAARNLIPACKNIGTTHVTNGAYRLHPVEWAIGEAAGVLAAYCWRHHTSTPRVIFNRRKLRTIQDELASAGAPLYWYDDVPTDHPHFQAIQFLAVTGIMRGAADDLNFRPDDCISDAEFAAVAEKFHLSRAELGDVPATATRAQFAQFIYDRLAKSKRWFGRL